MEDSTDCADFEYYSFGQTGFDSFVGGFFHNCFDNFFADKVVYFGVGYGNYFGHYLSELTLHFFVSA